MVIGHDTDLQEVGVIKRAYEKNNRPANRVLINKEFQCFSERKSAERQIEFLAGYWAAEEALAKAMGIGIGTFGFKDIEILNNQLGAPVIIRSPFSGKCPISLSYTGNLVQASVILEDSNWIMKLKQKHSKNFLALEEIK